MLTVGWAVFVAGGLGTGWAAVHNFAVLAQPHARRTVGAAQPAEEPLAPHPQLRDFDQSPPPFAAAGNPPAETPVDASSPAGRLSILLLGIDQRPDEATAGRDPGRTDTMLLVSIDFDAHTASMVSIPRDGFVVIPDHGNERVNAAYTLGEIDQRGAGPALAKRTVAQVFGVPVDRYALVDVH